MSEKKLNCFKTSLKLYEHIALFQNIAKVTETSLIVSKHHQSDRNTSHCFKTLIAIVSITWAMF